MEIWEERQPSQTAPNGPMFSGKIYRVSVTLLVLIQTKPDLLSAATRCAVAVLSGHLVSTAAGTARIFYGAKPYIVRLRGPYRSTHSISTVLALSITSLVSEDEDHNEWSKDLSTIDLHMLLHAHKDCGRDKESPSVNILMRLPILDQSPALTFARLDIRYDTLKLGFCNLRTLKCCVLKRVANLRYFLDFLFEKLHKLEDPTCRRACLSLIGHNINA